MTKQRAVVICPGRGTYNKDELGYFARNHSDKTSITQVIDAERANRGQKPVAELDAMDKFSMRLHTAGENASSLIYACSLGDYLSINQDEFDIVAVTGNSMGWYIALAVAQAVNAQAGAKLINTMGSMMENGLVGGQIIYPIVNEYWHPDSSKESLVAHIVAELNQQQGVEIHTSIKLGGYIVLGANEAGLKALEQSLPNIDDKYPMKLFNHGAFHTPLLDDISSRAFEQLGNDMFDAPSVPMVDGRGHIWQPYSTDAEALRDYTLGHQVVDYYDFTKAIEVAVKEFAPDKLIITGPGATLGGAVAQSLIRINWQGIDSKEAFIARQKADPFIISMGMNGQRELVL